MMLAQHLLDGRFVGSWSTFILAPKNAIQQLLGMFVWTFRVFCFASDIIWFRNVFLILWLTVWDSFPNREFFPRQRPHPNVSLIPFRRSLPLNNPLGLVSLISRSLHGAHGHGKVKEFEICIPGLEKSWELEKFVWVIVMEFQILLVVVLDFWLLK